jgi:hypothetical protein
MPSSTSIGGSNRPETGRRRGGQCHRHDARPLGSGVGGARHRAVRVLPVGACAPVVRRPFAAGNPLQTSGRRVVADGRTSSRRRPQVVIATVLDLEVSRGWCDWSSSFAVVGGGGRVGGAGAWRDVAAAGVSALLRPVRGAFNLAAAPVICPRDLSIPAHVGTAACTWRGTDVPAGGDFSRGARTWAGGVRNGPCRDLCDLR